MEAQKYKKETKCANTKLHIYPYLQSVFMFNKIKTQLIFYLYTYLSR